MERMRYIRVPKDIKAMKDYDYGVQKDEQIEELILSESQYSIFFINSDEIQKGKFEGNQYILKKIDKENFILIGINKFYNRNKYCYFNTNQLSNSCNEWCNTSYAIFFSMGKCKFDRGYK